MNCIVRYRMYNFFLNVVYIDKDPAKKVFMYNNKIQCVSARKNRTRNSSTVHVTMLDLIMRYFVD